MYIRRHAFVKIAACVALVLSATLSPPRADPKLTAIEITYLGNEDFLIPSGSSAVLFDALSGAALPEYDRVPPGVVRDRETARPPFVNIDVVFISHIHPLSRMIVVSRQMGFSSVRDTTYFLGAFII